MNREFIKLSNDEYIVTDENGHILKKSYTDNVQGILLLENKIEILDNKLEKLNKDLRDQEGVLWLSKQMLKSIPIVLLLVTLGGFVIGGFTSNTDFLTYGIYYGVKGFVYSSFFGGVEAIFWGIVKPIYNKKLEKTKNQIIISEELKETKEKELLEIREKQVNITNTMIETNKPVSLIKETDMIESQINEEINLAYIEISKNKSKKLVLRKRK